VPRIGASRNRKSRALTADSVPGKDIPAAGKVMSVLQAKRAVLRAGCFQIMAGEALVGDGPPSVEAV
jgi:hypothetical protein